MMNLSSYPYKLISQCLFLTSICILITSLKSEATPSNYRYFNYTESAAGTISPFDASQVVNVQTYDDGTILVRIARESDSKYNCTGQSLEQVLRLRVIQLNGTIKEINPHLNLDPVNYCIFNDSYGNPVNPITIYPLYQRFILVNYYVKAPNLIDPTTYQEWANVIDWGGNILSQAYYGPSYTYPNGTLSPRSLIQLNINKRQGFFRLNTARQNNLEWTEWQQYSVDDSGKLSKLTSNNISIFNPNATSFMVTTMSTVTGDYAILNVNSSIDYNTSSLTTPGGLYITFIPYNQSVTTGYLLSQITLNVTFSGLYCDIAPSGVGYMCIIETIYNNSNTYLKVNFLTSGSVTSITLLNNIPDNNTLGIIIQGFGMRAMAFGGYIFYAKIRNNTCYIWVYDENNKNLEQLGPFTTNKFAANAANSIMKNNNTFILVSSDTNGQSWSLHMIQLPKIIEDHGFSNPQIFKIDPSPINSSLTRIDSAVDSHTNALNITFKNPVILSTGFITIYKSSDNTIRQKIQATMKEYVKIIDNNNVIITIIGSTFNQNDEIYYLQMDANFVRDEKLYEPLTGIGENVVNYKSKNNPSPSDEAVICLAYLTTSATKKFKMLNEDNKADYLKALLKEISVKLPVLYGLLTTDGNYQYISINSNENTQFAIYVNKISPKLDSNATVPGIISDLNNMIKYKRITTFSYGLTNDLDENYGFKPKGDKLGDYKKEIISFVTVAAVNFIVYNFSQSDKPIPDSWQQIINIATAGLFVISHSIFSTIFAFFYAGNYPALSLPSQIVWAIPIAINIVLLSYILCIGGFHKFTFMNFIIILLTLFDCETLLFINQNKIDEIFDKKSKTISKYRAYADIFIKNITQLIIQILYYKLNGTYSIIPLFTLCTSILMIVLTTLQSLRTLLKVVIICS